MSDISNAALGAERTAAPAITFPVLPGVTFFSMEAVDAFALNGCALGGWLTGRPLSLAAA